MTRTILTAAGCRDIVLTPKPDYVRSKEEWNDPLHWDIAASLPEGERISDYVASLGIEAGK